MTNLAVGDPVCLIPSGPPMTLTAINGDNGTVQLSGRSFALPLAALRYSGVVVNVPGSYRAENSGAVTPVLLPSDAIVKVVNNATTGVTARTICPVGQGMFITNGTAADFTTGDFLIPSGGTWYAYWDGGNWQTVQGV